MANVSEKHQRLLADLLREEANRVCGDCGSRGTWCVRKFESVSLFAMCRGVSVSVSPPALGPALRLCAFQLRVPTLCVIGPTCGSSADTTFLRCKVYGSHV